MSKYANGRALEYDVMKDLKENGYTVFRSAGSHGAADVIAFKAGEVLFVQCKIDGKCPPKERVALIALADLVYADLYTTPYAAALAIVAQRPRVTYRRLTGPGISQWTKWAPDQITAAMVTRSWPK